MTLSRALDFTVSGIEEHHLRVAVIALKLANEINLSEQEKTTLFYSCLLHDAGVSSSKLRDKLKEFDFSDDAEHCEDGFILLMRYPPLEKMAHAIRYHHDRWAGGNISGLSKQQIPLLSSIIHLADRIDILIKKDTYVLEQSDAVCEHINCYKGKYFRPDLVDCFNKLALIEAFWLDLVPGNTQDVLGKVHETSRFVVDIDTLMNLGEIFASIIDNKSKFTRMHSRGVSSVAKETAKLFGLSEREVSMMSLAGLLHDIGKLSVPDEILDKSAKLTKQEFDIIKQHTFYTFHILGKIDNFDEMNKWAAYHHERLDGKGYPFRISGYDMPIGARIMAVSDTFTALSEDRPYRKSQEKDMVVKILDKEVEKRGLDGRIVNMVKDNYDSIHQAFEQAKNNNCYSD
ncbi:MAG: HD-GYP domain-containing protein [Candidatus Brocadiales bacterium]